ncbi:MAG: hypothetical protein WCH99_07435 [Verrucomicrobiota bacterium]
MAARSLGDLPGAQGDWSARRRSVATPDGEQVVTAAGNRWIEVHSAYTGASEKSFRFAENLDTSINQLTISPSGQWALLNTFNHWWRLNLSTSQATEVFTNHDQPVACAFRHGDQILVSDVGGELHWWKFPELSPHCQRA